jgi:hypothetical protein
MGLDAYIIRLVAGVFERRAQSVDGRPLALSGRMDDRQRGQKRSGAGPRHKPCHHSTPHVTHP